MNHSRVKFSMRVGSIDNRGLKFIQKCSNCGSLCEFIEKNYPGDDFLDEIDYLIKPLKEKKTFMSDSVIRDRDVFRTISKKGQKELGVKIRKFKQQKQEEIEREEHKKIDDRNKQIDKIKNQRQKESDEYWESFISKYPLLGISNWLFGEKNIGKFINK